MEIEKIFNNNVVLSKNAYGEEVVCMGRGLAFQKKVGAQIDLRCVEKEFVLKNDSTAAIFHRIMTHVTVEEFEVVKKIVALAEQELRVELSMNCYFALAETLHFALQRPEENESFSNPLLFEIKKFYTKEYRVAKKSLEFIRERLQVTLPKASAGLIAVHLVNGQQALWDMEQTLQMMELMRDMLAMVKELLVQQVDEESLSYQRLVTHIQFFLQRYLSDESSVEAHDEFLYTLVQTKYPTAFLVVQRLHHFLLERVGQPIGKAEQVYLALHCQQLFVNPS